jgi:glycosyltransferase involved in cell wall biosynthesis
MSKLLSIIIPTYNMEALLPRCLDSILVEGALDRIEAMVVNDGSKDGSLAVANGYKQRFPDSVTVIDKPNGNYGSTINAALPVAKGKYVKILDSDDWFDSISLISFLDSLESTDTDMVITHFNTINDDNSKEETKYNVYGKEPYEYGRAYNLDDVLKDGYIRFFLMHGLAYRTQMLRDMGYRQTEGISYTDTEWCCYPVFRAKDITFLNINLYQYNLAREGQTMDPKVIARSLDQLEKMTLQLISFYSNYDIESLSDIRLAFVKQYYTNRIRLLYKTFLLDIPRDLFNAEELTELDIKLTDACKQFGFGPIRLYPANKILRLDALKYWHKNHSRWPVWLEKTNRLIDSIMTWLFVRVFKKSK